MHRSHVLRYLHGVWYCVMCGHYTVSVGKASPKRLRESCLGNAFRRGADGKAGRDYLRRLKKGQPPKYNMQWPSPESAHLSLYEEEALLQGPRGQGFFIIPCRRLRRKTRLTCTQLAGPANPGEDEEAEENGLGLPCGLDDGPPVHRPGGASLRATQARQASQ